MAWSWAYSTNAGRKSDMSEKENEDRAHSFELHRVLYQIVADGNGTINDVYPAAFVVNEIERFIYDFADEGMSLAEIKRMILGAIHCANRVLLAYKRVDKENVAQQVFSTICITATTEDNDFVFAWVGDSRIYLIRSNKLVQITKDQTEAQRLFDEEKITKEEIFSHPDRNILTSAVGFDNPDIEILTGSLAKEDILFMVTDGIYKTLTPEQIVEIIENSGNCEAGCEALIEAGNLQGGPDNMAVAMCYVAS